MNRNERSGAIRRKPQPLPGAADRDLVYTWSEQILHFGFLLTRNLTEALGIMRNRAVGCYAFMRHDKMEGAKFSLLLRDHNNTVRYNIRPNRDYSAYIMSTLDGEEWHYATVLELIAKCRSVMSDQGRSTYEMSRNPVREDMPTVRAPSHGPADRSDSVIIPESARGRTRARHCAESVRALLEDMKVSDRYPNTGAVRDTPLHRYPPSRADEEQSRGRASSDARSGEPSPCEPNAAYAPRWETNSSRPPSIHRSRKGALRQTADPMPGNLRYKESYPLVYRAEKGTRGDLDHRGVGSTSQGNLYEAMQSPGEDRGYQGVEGKTARLPL
ncbi:hypothetical protein KUCAC02_033098 [Chaenocephalus aceratus]|nr:hypothetical protein KUCAC02_033098 [Chaenocephalus aceratus]